MTGLADKILAIHDAFDAVRLPHAFGGALALAWCTERARGTIDIDVNIFVDAARARAVIDALPRQVTTAASDVEILERDGQARLWWDETPIDVFLNTSEFHEQLAERARLELFAGVELPFLSCTDLAVFKAFFNRTRDWADLEDMVAMRTFDVDRVVGVLTRYLGADDDRVRRLLGLVS